MALYINDILIEKKHFPDGTQMLLDFPTIVLEKENIIFRWVYENDEECMTLYFLVNHIRSLRTPQVKKILLELMYIPNARMDRVKQDTEVFTLKYFAKFINDLHFDTVYSLDAHSNVALALIDHLYDGDISRKLHAVIAKTKILENSRRILYFPDEGAKKRYSYLTKNLYFDVCFGEKVRDWETGKILGLEIKSDSKILDIEGKDVLMVDDIISYGGTMYYSALKLKGLGANNIYIYCSHLENSVLDNEHSTLIKLLDDGTITKLYTTNSLFTGKHPSIEVI